MLDSMNVSLRTHYSWANFPLLFALFGWPFFSTVMRFKNYWLLILFFCSTLALSLDNQSAISNCGDCAVHCIIALFLLNHIIINNKNSKNISKTHSISWYLVVLTIIFHLQISHRNKFTVSTIYEIEYAMNDDNVFLFTLLYLSQSVSSYIYPDIVINVIRFPNAKDTINFELTMPFKYSATANNIANDILNAKLIVSMREFQRATARERRDRKRIGCNVI